MWLDLRSFYSSKEWKNKRLSLLLERRNNQGILYCEHCGKIIVDTRDCAVHHKKPLTPSNVNDVDNISLNDDNLIVIHNECHNEIHERMGYSVKKVIFVWGSVCSGKSSYVRSMAGRNDIILDLDNIYEAISINERYNKPDSIKSMALTIRNTMIEQIKMRAIFGNAYVISSEPLLMKRERLIQRVNADEVIYMECSQEEALERLYNDPQRTNYIKLQEQFINDFYNKLQL